MSGPNGKSADLVVRWSAVAQRSLDQSMAYINAQDSAAGELILRRVKTAIDLILLQPGIGTQINRRNVRRFPVPKTGHTIEYRVEGNVLVIRRWIRQARLRKI